MINGTTEEICPCVEYSKDNGRTWETWCFFHLGQVGEARACYGRLVGLYPEFHFRISAGIMDGRECQCLIERCQQYESNICELERCLQFLAEKCESIEQTPSGGYRLKYFNNKGFSASIAGPAGRDSIHSLVLAIMSARETQE